MNTKTRLMIATLAASAALSFSAFAATTPSASGPMPLAQAQPSTALVSIYLPYVPAKRESAARFTPPEFCYSGRMKVACTLTNAPSSDPTRPEATARFTPPEFCYVGKWKLACTLTDAPSKDPTRP